MVGHAEATRVFNLNIELAVLHCCKLELKFDALLFREDDQPLYNAELAELLQNSVGEPQKNDDEEALGKQPQRRNKPDGANKKRKKGVFEERR
eukprot:1495218-Amphidinium_carterae.1